MRSALTAGVALVAGLLGFASVATAETEITFVMWVGAEQEVVPTEVIKAYMASHPDVKINILESNNTIIYPQMVTARRTTPDDPYIHCGLFNVETINNGDVDDLWESLNRERIPNIANVLPKYHRPDDRGVGYQMLGIGLMYNKEKVATPPTSWSDLWSPPYKDHVALWEYDPPPLVMAARLNGGDERNIDPGFKVWSENAQNIRAFVDSNIALKNLLDSGEAWIAPWYSAIASQWVDENGPLGFVIPKEGAVAFSIFLAIAKGVDDAERAVCEDLLNELLSPAQAGRYGALTRSVPVVTNAELTDRQKTDPIVGLGIAETAIHLDNAYIAQELSGWRERWDQEVKAKLR